VTDTAFIYSSAKTGYYLVGPFDMAPTGSPSAASFTLSSDGGQGLGIRPGGASSSCFMTGLHFPQGATLTQLIVHFRSGANASGQPSFTLWRTTPTGDFLTLGTRTFADDTGANKAGAVTLSPSAAVVNNSLYTYGLQVCLAASSDMFYGARIAYTYKTAGD
jgi:hypothetical protein